MKFNRFSTAALAGVVLLALTSCSSGGDVASDSSKGNTNGSVNTEAPLYDQLPEAIKTAGLINIVGDTHPPYRTLEEDGTITGLDPEVQAALSEQLGVPFVMQTSSGLDAMLTGMLSHRYDAFNGPVRTSAEREKEFDSAVWMTTRTSYLYLTENKDKFGAPENLCGARVAGVSGSVTESQLERYTKWCTERGLETPKFMGFADTNSTVLAVQSDRADYSATTQTGALDIQAQNEGTFEFLVQTDEQGAGIDQLAMFMPKDIKLGPVMLKAFEGIFENGKYQKIMSEWKLDDVMVEAPSLNPMTAKGSGE